MADPPAESAITVTYATHTSPQSSTLLASITALLDQQFPLRNLHWRPSQATVALRGAVDASLPHALRTLQTLPVQLVPLHAHAHADARAPILPRTPCVHLFFVACDDNDTYRTKVRNEVRNWIASLPAYMPQDFAGMPMHDADGREVPASIEPQYLIVLVPPIHHVSGEASIASAGQATPAGSKSAAAAGKGAMGRFYSMNKGTVLEKLKADFNASTHERVVHLAKLQPHSAPAANADPTIWIELIARMKEGVTHTIGQLVELQDRILTTYNANAAHSENSFCGAFVRTERLIETLEGVELLDDALALYDQLDNRLARSIAEHSIELPSVGTTEPGDDSLLLLGPLRKPYHDMILRETISLFDLRCYVFARRAMLLGTLGHVVHVMQATPAFIASVARMLATRATHLTPFFIESWSFSVALDAVAQCQAWLVEQNSEEEDASQLQTFHSSKAALLEVAIWQLMRIGIYVGYLPNKEPFTLATLPSLRAQDHAVTRKELVEAIASRNVFDSHLRNLIHRSVLAASLCHQQHRMTRLKFILGCIELDRAAFQDVHNIFTGLLHTGFSPEWGTLHCALYARYFACLRAQDLDHGPVWAERLTAALSAVCATRCMPGAVQALDEEALLQGLRTTSEDIDTDATLVGYNGCDIQLASKFAWREPNDDGAWLRVHIVSHLSFVLDVAQVGVCVANYRQEQLWFLCGARQLCPGLNVVDVYCATPAQGYFHLQTTQLRYGTHVCLENVVYGTGALSTLADAQQHEYVRARVFLPPNGDTLAVHAGVRRDVHLDAPHCVELRIQPGHNMVDGTIHLEMDQDVRLAPWSDAEPYAMQCSAPDAKLDSSADGSLLRLSSIAPHCECRIVLPLAMAPRTGRFELSVLVQYTTAQSHPEEQRAFARVLDICLALPLGIQIEDHFRTKCIFSRLTMESSGKRYVRICAPKLDTPPASALEVAIEAEDALVLAPGNPIAFLLQFLRRGAERRANDAPPFQLTVAYRTLQDEVTAMLFYLLALQLVRTEIPTNWTHGDQTLLQSSLRAFVCEAEAEQRCGEGGMLCMPPFEACDWEKRAAQFEWPRDKARLFVALVRAVLDAVPTAALSGAVESTNATFPRIDTPTAMAARVWQDAQACFAWRTLSVPLSVPFMDAVHAVFLSPSETHAKMDYPIQVTITIRTTLAWGAAAADADLESPVHLQYNILNDYVHWLVLGTKKGTFTIPAHTETHLHTLTASLLPVRPGALLLPHISVGPVPPTESTFRCDTYMANGAQTLNIVEEIGHDMYWVDLRPIETISS
ncbi:hypothetical protein MVES1_003047 [Malassezia vespertilionis]|uniref:Uncharacterized protein n=1 Tax=Malassezia vespertilionis TaxID=2020962 RepID=A0A2N1J9A4_9BASI|nr:uncharacterized protein MVES1_003047 [Malassezia vespertilionis]PKI83126.1 hypothetical protein MVES_002889 [Malassezia vespertilionis]WFD07678.1 hypothetical protein MVES1_003047 [Malassezia vespertilionis]